MENDVLVQTVTNYCKYAQGSFKKSRPLQVAVFFISIVGFVSVSYMTSMKNYRLSPFQRSSQPLNQAVKDPLGDALEKASMRDKTLVVMTINKQYTANNSILDLFLESLRHGQGTQYLIRHLFVGALDDTAFDQCRARGLHCYRIASDGVHLSSEKLFMSEDYLGILWRRVLFFTEVLARGYNFLLFDADMVWFRDPFTQLNWEDDVQMSCDGYEGKPYDHRANKINAGFYFVRSSNRTIELFRRWYAGGQTFPYMLDQDVLDVLRKNHLFDHLGLKFRYLETLYFSGFCQRGKDLRKVITLHANCCRTIKAKILDLKAHLHAWRTFMESDSHNNSTGSWPNEPSNCWASWKKLHAN